MVTTELLTPDLHIDVLTNSDLTTARYPANRAEWMHGLYTLQLFNKQHAGRQNRMTREQEHRPYKNASSCCCLSLAYSYTVLIMLMLASH